MLLWASEPKSLLEARRNSSTLMTDTVLGVGGYIGLFSHLKQASSPAALAFCQPLWLWQETWYYVVVVEIQTCNFRANRGSQLPSSCKGSHRPTPSGCPCLWKGLSLLVLDLTLRLEKKKKKR